MRHFALSFIVFCLAGSNIIAQTERDACTSIMVGKNASVDGSVMTSHTCDSWYRTWMSIEPAKDYPRDTIMTIYEGLMHTEHSKDMTGVKERGTIPQARHTYRFLNTAYPCLNEKQLAMGETTISGRDTLRNKNGLFMIEELQRVALQRCTTARQAIRLMGSLIKEYGYGDSGECLTIADQKEVWIFEVFGEGPKQKGGVWAAQRIPDDEVAVSANICRIGKIDLSDTDHFMASDNVFSVAKQLNLWDGKEEFSFWKAYSGGNYFDEPKNYSVRELFIMQQLAPDANFTDEMGELPLSVKPKEKLSVEKVSKLLGSYYEGTDLSLSCKIDSLAKDGDGVKLKGGKPSISNPWMRPDEIRRYAGLLNDSTMANIRTVSVSWCAYSTVIQLRSWMPDAIGGVAWIALDNPGQSPRFPIFAGNTELPMMLGVCGQHRKRDDAALWHYREANRISSMKWGQTRESIQKAQQHFWDKANQEQPFVEQTWWNTDEKDRTAFLNGYTADFFNATIGRWDELARKYWRQFWSGF
jgi:dipeptidase